MKRLLRLLPVLLLFFTGQEASAQDRTAAGNIVDITLSREAFELEGLVVAVLGITREQRADSTSVQEISAERLTETPEAIAVTALSGKVAGAAITNSGTQGGSARVVLRGATSVTGNK